MKRLIIPLIVLAILIVLLLAANTHGAKKASDNPAVMRVVSTIFAPYDFARVIAGNKADVSMLLPPGSETHSFEPTPQDIIKIQKCDVFIYVGGESDKWVGEILKAVDTSRMRIITLMDCVSPVEEKIAEGMEKEEERRGSEADSPEYDEHVWTSPKNAELIVRKITDAFCETDAANADTYRQNAAEYTAKLDELDKGFERIVDGAKRRTIVFGDRFPFRYFADAYGLDYFAAFPGCSAETEASAATLKFLIDKINTSRIPVVFHIELASEKMARAISEATGAKVLLLHSCHNISKADFENGVSYLDLMTRNAVSLREALR
ncbi:hypothetical protein FACS1894216_15450 [Synergistales bacterium]|nr:hypothetical protein FACS1894216_15450 [Synergistales bacterium]